MLYHKVMPKILFLLLILFPISVYGEEKKPDWSPQLLGAQATGIYQSVPSFKNPYQGEKSFVPDQKITHTYGLYLGSQVTKNLQAYWDVEMFRGTGVSNGYGLGGYSNGDVIRAGQAGLSDDPYVARLYLRYSIPLSNETIKVERGIGQLPGREAKERVDIKFGKFAATDDMDWNRYANNTKTQFLNYSFIFNPAWDYASDTRGYSYGVSIAYVLEKWRIVFGSFMEPTTANGYNMDTDVYRARGDNLEIGYKPYKTGTVKVLFYHNQGRMGTYQDAMNIASATNTIPSIHANEQPGRSTYGATVNFEQQLADKGETGAFMRLGWQKGQVSTWSYAEVDRHFSMGFQLNGIHWNRPKDYFGFAYAVNGISDIHREYLDKGGIGMLIGDGRLDPLYEMVYETYYRIQMGKYFQLTPDYQRIVNPTSNHARGPIDIYGLRARLYF